VRRAPVAAAALAAAWAVPAPASHVPALSAALGLRRRLADPRAVALTFDDGPHPRGTPAVLEILAAAGARATFFLVGEQVERTGGLTAEIAAAGHVVAVHGQRHRNLLRVPPRAAVADLDRAAAVIGDAAGAPVAPLHRPPYGIYSWAALASVRARGWTPLLWSRWGRDWRARATAESVAAEASGGLRGGEVLLLHDADDYGAPGSWRATVAALPRVLEAIAAAGLAPAAAAGASDLAQGR
jgi:peptidoglycan/xylan/chitin deacetylase (PgdA/CDA1 family)